MTKTIDKSEEILPLGVGDPLFSLFCSSSSIAAQFDSANNKSCSRHLWLVLSPAKIATDCSTHCQILPKICPFLPCFSRRNWRVIFEVFHSNWEMFTSSLRWKKVTIFRLKSDSVQHLLTRVQTDSHVKGTVLSMRRHGLQRTQKTD